MKRFIVLVFSTLLPIAASAQARVFAPGVVSNGGIFGLTLSEDSQRIFFVNSKGKRDTLSIEMSIRENKRWSTPVPLAFSRRGIWKDIDPFITPDQRSLIFNSNRNDEQTGSTSNMDVWIVALNEDGSIGKPYRLGAEVNTDAPEYFATSAANGNLYFTSIRADDHGKSNIYKSEFKRGSYQPAVRLDAPINTAFDESNPYISAQEDFLIFVKMGHEGGFGDSDLYISFNKNGTWSSPINLGADVNTEYAEFCPYYHAATQTLYFGRIARGANPKEDIFYIKLDVQALRNQSMK